MKKLYTRVGRGQYAITVPACFTRSDVKSTRWPDLQEAIIDGVIDSCDLAFRQVEKDIRNKK